MIYKSFVHAKELRSEALNSDTYMCQNREMEKISIERNRFQDWNTAIIDVQKRNETLRQIEEAATKQEEEIQILQN